MTKQDLLKQIADAGYNVGFGAKKHFATYDINAKVPGFIGFVSTGVGVFGLVYESLSAKSLSATFIVLGIMGIVISRYDSNKEQYAAVGTQLTQIFNRLKALYFHVKASQETDLKNFESQFEILQAECNKIGISDQMLFSGWLAHYKFFWEHQIDWIDEQKHFRFFRDKLPLSFMFTMTLAIIIAICIWLSCGGHKP